ncbi:DUF3367 domain-containing protein [Amycolatopsis acidicola]|uniref:DUF3367 domain-containing protein n=1 Tax=Amycolatopsis acidicola TaxID=2596893 RepID=A0A5N0UQS7_9PSEU|nr:alpha-(1->3)-arabinofuranosyltransferase family protein [Amycolatopsis acidicola]KAA9149717.1 DUF3367 domain-containing protein [Amycolatopsis acidicola]
MTDTRTATEPHGGGTAPPPVAIRRGGAEPGGPRTVSRWWPLWVWLLAFVVFLLQSPGKMTFDTKLGVNLDPAGFYTRLAHLWNPLQWFGGLQDQYIGYAFPMGVFSLLGQVVHIPVWITERLWMSLLVAAGFWGLTKLATRLGIGSPRTRLVAAAAFVLWPTFTVLIGSTSAAVLPGLLAPWAVVPLVTAVEGGSARLAAARSGLVVLAMGGVNGASTIAALSLPLLYLLIRVRRHLALLLWWLLAVVLATAWWVVPLVLQGRYGFNFLPYIEQAANTNQTTSAATVLRGSGNWVAYLNFGNAWLTAGWAVVSTPLVIAASTVTAALGLTGLARRDLPEGRWLRLATGVAALVLLAGYAGPMGGLFHGTVQNWLDGWLAPFRNIYKFEPVIAATLSLGIAHLLARPIRRPRRAKTVLAIVATAAVLIGLAAPYGTGKALQPGSFSAVPSYWDDAADYLAEHAPNEPTLVTPADSHGIYAWGVPVDEPLEPLARSPWVQRQLVPFSGAGSQSMLTAAEKALESGDAQPGLGTYLARAGVRYVLVRNDLDPNQLDYVSPDIVHRTLDQSGFTRVTSFGPETTAGYVHSGTALSVQGLMGVYPALEIFQAPAQQDTGPVAVQPTADAIRADTDPGSLLDLANQGVLGDEAVISSGRADTQVLTDGNRRQDTTFGLVNHNESYTYTETGTNPADDPHGGGGEAPRQLLASNGDQTVAQLSGATDVTASSYGSWLWELPQYDPVNAFDGNPDTAWTQGRADSGEGQWLQIRLDHRQTLPVSVPIQLLSDSAFRPVITRVVTTTEAGSATTDLRATSDTQQLRVPPGSTSWLRVTIEQTTGGVTGGPAAGIREITIPGTEVTRYLRVPGVSGGARHNVVSLHRDTVSPLPLGESQPEPELARTFTTATAQDMTVSATATAVPGAGLNALLDQYRTGASGLAVTATSTWGGLPQYRVANAADGDWRTAWLAGAPNPTLRLSWTGTRSIGELTIVPAGGLSTMPTTLRVQGADGTREVTVPNTSTTPVPAIADVKFDPLTTDYLDISFPTLTSASSYDPLVGAAAPLLVGIGDIGSPALADLTAKPLPDDTPVSLPCGSGPPLTVDGTEYQTSAETTLGDLAGFRPITVAVCTSDGTVPLSAGRHTLTSSSTTGALAITDLTLASGTAPTTATPARSVHVSAWGAENRQLTIGAGAESFVEVHETYNSGWTATMNGVRLTPVQLDGWQQGFVVPAGADGTITLSFTPATAYRAALIASGIGVVVLVLGALIRGRRRKLTPVPDQGRATKAGLWVALAAVTGLLVIVGGVVAVVVPVLAGLAFLRPRWLPVIAGLAMLGAGVCAVVGVALHGVATGYGALGGPAQVFALAALAAALMPWFAEGKRP